MIGHANSRPNDRCLVLGDRPHLGSQPCPPLEVLGHALKERIPLILEATDLADALLLPAPDSTVTPGERGADPSLYVQLRIGHPVRPIGFYRLVGRWPNTLRSGTPSEGPLTTLY
jgi:hypothetical protein